MRCYESIREQFRNFKHLHLAALISKDGNSFVSFDLVCATCARMHGHLDIFSYFLPNCLLTFGIHQVSRIVCEEL
jgi:hypothetical protein